MVGMADALRGYPFMRQAAHGLKIKKHQHHQPLHEHLCVITTSILHFKPHLKLKRPMIFETIVHKFK
jgi:hypothetical protein